MTVTLGNGLEEIGESAFNSCTALQHIVIPNAVKTIKRGAFGWCSGLFFVTLGDRLEEIGEFSFKGCTSLHGIVIPPVVKRIHDTAFRGCSSLTSVKFRDDIEQFVSSKAMRGWWNQGVHGKSLATYCFLIRCGIPKHFLGLSKISSWQANIYGMPGCIPTVSNEGMNAYLDTIDTKLTVYDNLLNQAHVLIPEQFWLDEGINLNILSFL
jgi:hypothetical protein